MSKSERDELIGKLSNTICNASNYPDRAVPHLLGGDMSRVLDKTADALLAAGYRNQARMPEPTMTAAEKAMQDIGAALDHYFEGSQAPDMINVIARIVGAYSVERIGEGK